MTENEILYVRFEAHGKACVGSKWFITTQKEFVKLKMSKSKSVVLNWNAVRYSFRGGGNHYLKVLRDKIG